MIWHEHIITHSEKQFTNSSKNSIGKILSVKMIVLCIISIYALSHYSSFLLTLGTVKHFPNVHILLGFSTSCVSSWYNGISEEMVLTCIPLLFLGFPVFNTFFKSFFDIIQIFLYFWRWDIFTIFDFSREGTQIRNKEEKKTECFSLNLLEI